MKIDVVWIVYCTNLRTVCLCAVSVSASPSVSTNLSAAMESDDSDVRCIIWCVLLMTFSSAAPVSRLWSLPLCCVTQNTVTTWPASSARCGGGRGGVEGGRRVHLLVGEGVIDIFWNYVPVSTWMQTEKVFFHSEDHFLFTIVVRTSHC